MDSCTTSFIKTKSPRVDTHTSPQTPPAPADIYGARLLAYATATADQISSSEHDTLAYQRWGGAELVAEANDELDDIGTFVEPAQDDQPNAGLPPHVFSADSGVEPWEDELLQPQDYTSTSSIDPLLVYDEPLDQLHPLDTIVEVSAVDENEAPSVIDSDMSDPADTGYLDDWQGEPHNESTEEDLEESGILVPEYEDMQAEEDEVAANEPSEDDAPEQDMKNVLREELILGTPEPPQRNPSIRPFPMSISRRSCSPDKEVVIKGDTMTKLSPKFASQLTRRVRPSPFAALLKKRREETSTVEGTKGQNEHGIVEDEIESWPG